MVHAGLPDDAMVEPRHLRNAPIAEAIVDLRAVLSPDFDPNALRAARDRLSKDYPGYSERNRFETGFQFSPGQPVAQQSRHLGMQGVFLRSADEKTVVQFRVDGFTLNRLKPYTSWEEHIEPEVLRLWEIYRELANPLAVTRIALRYINQITLPPSGDLEALMTTGPRLPQDVQSYIMGFTTQVLLENREHQIAAQVTQMLDTERPEPLLLLDIDAYRVDENSPMEPAPLLEILRNLRAYKNSIFFGSLRPGFVETFA